MRPNCQLQLKLNSVWSIIVEAFVNKKIDGVSCCQLFLCDSISCRFLFGPLALLGNIKFTLHYLTALSYEVLRCQIEVIYLKRKKKTDFLDCI